MEEEEEFTWRHSGGVPVDGALEIPPTPACIRALLDAAPPRTSTSLTTGVGGKLASGDEGGWCHAVLAAHEAQFCAEYTAPCGWVHDPHDRVIARASRVLRLLWPWEVQETDDGRLVCHRANERDVRVRRVQDAWARASMHGYLGTSPGRSAFTRTAHHHARLLFVGPDAAVDLASRVTDPDRHHCFASVRGPNVALLLTAAGRRTPFCCQAVAAHSTTGGVRRYYVPDDAVGFRGFVSSDPSVLRRAPDAASARRGGVAFHPPPAAVVISEQYYRPEDPRLIQNLTDDDLLAEARVSCGARELRDEVRRAEHGLTPAATRACWPYRYALCRLLARRTARAVHYTEYRRVDAELCLSSEMVCVSPAGDATTAPLVYERHDDAPLLVLWDGMKWGLLKS